MKSSSNKGVRVAPLHPSSGMLASSPRLHRFFLWLLGQSSTQTRLSPKKSSFSSREVLDFCLQAASVSLKALFFYIQLASNLAQAASSFVRVVSFPPGQPTLLSSQHTSFEPEQLDYYDSLNEYSALSLTTESTLTVFLSQPHQSHYRSREAPVCRARWTPQPARCLQ